MKTSEKRENNLSHLAIIMDGNGRWSEQKGLPREDGHKEGVKSLRKLLRYIDDFNIPYLTVFSFSTDNWKRPKSEISNLMNLLRKFIQTDLIELHNKNVKISDMLYYDDETLQSDYPSIKLKSALGIVKKVSTYEGYITDLQIP